VLADVGVAVHRNVLSSSPRVVQAESVGVVARAPLSSERKDSALLGEKSITFFTSSENPVHAPSNSGKRVFQVFAEARTA
jgi:hypothetical protein